MSDAQEHLWYTRRYGHVRGPFPQQQITHYILLGRIREDDQLSLDREVWTPMLELQHLIPEVMRQVESEEDRQRLHLARLRVDERRGGDRRLGSERMSAEPNEQRRASDRRQDEDVDTLRHRELRRSVLDEGRAVQVGPCGPQCRRLLGAIVAVAIIFALFTPEAPPPAADCSVAAGPQVNWSNCQMPGLVAEQANLQGAQMRNMDLAGARLVGATLIGADLAYSQLNLADLRRADLSNARMTGASLRGTDLRGTRLAGADLSYANLSDARLEGLELSETRFDNAIWTDGRVCQPGSVAQCLVADE
ncbi:MAG: pentapeptide repeat-containing protein [Gammaproteobacteria bacterium]|nr:pentapeptide repeat-containing protein [Gammaproteobacteria bacterium]MBU2478957.1 pentapeptide repeat-containing protein [Gammaproteobacteria bacterium]